MSEARPATHRERRIQEYTEQLVREGWPYTMAYSRARDAYFSQDTKAPHLLSPRFTPELRAQFVEEQARSTVDLTGSPPDEEMKNERRKLEMRGECSSCGEPIHNQRREDGTMCRKCAAESRHAMGVYKDVKPNHAFKRFPRSKA